MHLRPVLLTSFFALVASGALAESNFNRITSFPVTANMEAGEDMARESSAEIVSASEDGMTLVYSDSPLGVIGLVDITDPRAPRAMGNIEMGGEPTTAVFIGDRVFAGVNTSESFANPSGKLVTIDPATREITAECDLGGQPDAVAKAPDGSFLAVAIENERDEDLGDGGLPQMPAGFVVKLPVRDGVADCAAKQVIDVTGLADIAPEDPEPEFVDVNAAGEIVVTLQENNHIVIIGVDGTVSAHFSAGEVTVEGIDTRRNGALEFTGTKGPIPREPDAVKWIDADHVAFANEGDWNGGTRGWSIFRRDGTPVWDAGASFEHAIIEIGHYPEHRSHSKGVEPEGMETGSFGGIPMVFVASERSSVVGVYDITDPAAPRLHQLLPSGISPEGIVAIPQRNLLVTANEFDGREDGSAGSHVMIYEWQEAPAAYPTITAAGAETLIGWGALSGLVADAERPGILYAVSDSVYANQAGIYTIDASQTPARITAKTVVTRNGFPAQKLDLEGIALTGDGGFWLASEGRTDRLTPHAILRVDGRGEIRQEIGLPPELLNHEIRFGFEGVSVLGDTLWLAVQREWKDDPKGFAKLVAYDTQEKTWGAVHYPLDSPADGAWMGLSEITIHGDWAYVIERDNRIGTDEAVKRLYRVPVAQLEPAELGGTLPVVSKELVRDLIPDLLVLNGYVQDKVEGFAIDAAGIGWAVTDNDGVQDASGETLFWSIGKVE
ncbi:esterase-like activity of phytase family protein [Rhodovulum tesquicola]|uniref:esterase-like activity of phytase family protein n=1 Tax=Rhodovulum tesquicola TaxID=540254 RepID=UPI002096DBEA|nr:esterase-like activity of phytase family protein [Rhodovulum tesquicola]MCO8146111.1 esterase-like activity of phytase family protein [Rhodovulum tesquicola]